MPSKKRSRPDADENRAECFYSVRQRAPTAQEMARHLDRKARREPLEEDRKAEWHWQTSPFNPTGFSKTSESMDVKYAIDTDAQLAPALWADMTRYNSFVCKYRSLPLPPPRSRLSLPWKGGGRDRTRD